MSKKLRALAVVLPQFHPIEENDKWWGKGFTEWLNVVRAKPRFKNHYQPHIPADLGFYDMRLEQTRAEQAKLAKEHGIFGFCYYHYWFNGQRLIEQPFNEVLKLKKPDFPFLLCWANENWTRRWDGKDREVLMKQDYSQEDHQNHAKYLCEEVFSDERYIKIDNKPVFLFYNTGVIPDLQITIETWREEVKKNGFPDVYLCGVKTFENAIPNAEKVGFDAVVEWQPDWDNLNMKLNVWNRIKNKLKIGIIYKSDTFESIVTRMLAKKKPTGKYFPGIMPSWDNSARRKNNAFIVKGSTPELYQKWLKGLCEGFEPSSDNENLVFINAWNEWAEGNHLEPDQKWGRAYLEATKNVLNSY